MLYTTTIDDYDIVSLVIQWGKKGNIKPSSLANKILVPSLSLLRFV